MVAAYRSHTSAAVDNTNITINKPAGVVDGDLLVCGILNGTSTNTTVNQSSAGWTQVRVAPGAEACLTILTKVAASEPASWTFVPSAAHHQIGVVVAISGASGNVEVGAAASANDTGGSDDGIVTATLTTTLSGVLVAIAGEESNSGAQTFTHTGGSFTERLDTTGTSDTHIGLYTQDGTAAGAKTITVTSTDTGMDTCAVMVLVEDAGGGGPATIEATASGAWGGLAGAVTADKTVEATTSGAWGALAGTVTAEHIVEALASGAWGGLAGTLTADKVVEALASAEWGALVGTVIATVSTPGSPVPGPIKVADVVALKTWGTWDSTDEGYTSFGGDATSQTITQQSTTKRTGAGALRVSASYSNIGFQSAAVGSPTVNEDVTGLGATLRLYVYPEVGNGDFNGRLFFVDQSFSWHFGAGAGLTEGRWNLLEWTPAGADATALATKRNVGFEVWVSGHASPETRVFYVDDFEQGDENVEFNDADPYVRVNGVWQRVDVMYRRESGQWVRYM